MRTGIRLVGTQDDAQGGIKRPAPKTLAGPADVGANLRRLRTAHGLSLEALAGLSGVSRAMLGQIETGKSTPTVTLLLRIAEALGVTLAALVDGPKTRPPFVLLPRSAASVATASSGLLTLRPLTAPAFPMPVEFSEVRIVPGHREALPAHGAGARASFVVSTGALEIAIGSAEAVSLSAGDAILFEADIPQTLFNPGRESAIGFLVVTAQRNGSA